MDNPLSVQQSILRLNISFQSLNFFLTDYSEVAPTNNRMNAENRSDTALLMNLSGRVWRGC